MKGEVTKTCITKLIHSVVLHSNPLKHEDFMKEYPLLFVSPEHKEPRKRSSTLYCRLSSDYKK